MEARCLSHSPLEEIHQRVCAAPHYWLTRVVDELRPLTADRPVKLDWPSIFDQLSPKGVAKPFTRQELFRWLHPNLAALDAQADDTPPEETWAQEGPLGSVVAFMHLLKNAQLYGDVPEELREAKRLADMDIGLGTPDEHIQSLQREWERRSKIREYAKDQISRLMDQVRAERSILFEAEIDGKRTIASYWRIKELEQAAAQAAPDGTNTAEEEREDTVKGKPGRKPKPLNSASLLAACLADCEHLHPHRRVDRVLEIFKGRMLRTDTNILLSKGRRQRREKHGGVCPLHPRPPNVESAIATEQRQWADDLVIED